MSALERLLGRVWYLTPRTAALLVAAAVGVAFARGAAAIVLAALLTGALAAAVVRDVRSVPREDELTVVRRMPTRFSIGVPNRVELVLRNASTRGAMLVLRETPPPSFDGTRRAGPFELAPRGEVVVPFDLTPRRRGLHHFGDVGVRLIGPLGLAGRQATIRLAMPCKVYPDLTAVREFALLARTRALPEVGIRALRRAGLGTEFASLREYRDGDDYRDIDWKATARRGHPIVREFEPERNQVLVLAIDTGRLMTPVTGPGGLSKLDRAVNAALLLAYLGIARGDLVGLLVFGRDIESYVPPRKGRRQLDTLVEALYAVEAAVEEPDYARALAYLSARLPRRALIALFTEVAGQEASHRLIDVLTVMSSRHLPLLLTQRNRQLEQRAWGRIDTEHDAFVAATVETVLRDKAEALAALAAHGTLVGHVEPERLSVAAINRYLEVKARALL